jgi:hypothetical protein
MEVIPIFKGTSVCYIWPVRDIPMSLVDIGTSGRGEVAVLLSLFSIYVSKLYNRENGRCG